PVDGQAHPVVGHPALGEVVGADALAAVAGAHLGTAGRCRFGGPLRLEAVVDAGPQHPEGPLPVLVLGFFILAGDHDARGQVGQANGRLRLVDVLAAGPAGPVGVDLDILGPDFHFYILHLGEDGHGGRGGVDAAGRLGDGHPLHPVDTAFKLQAAVGVGTGDFYNDFPDAAPVRFVEGDDLRAPVVALGVAQVHAQQVGGKQGGFIAAGPG